MGIESVSEINSTGAPDAIDTNDDDAPGAAYTVASMAAASLESTMLADPVARVMLEARGIP